MIRKTDTYEHVVEVVNFAPEHNDDWAFRVPHNCLEPLQPVPLPKLPDVFETTVSITNVEANMTMYLTEWVDEINQRIRFDGHLMNTSYEYYLDIKNVSSWGIVILSVLET